MNILFLTMGNFNSIEEHSLYPDLLRSFRNHNNNVYIIAPSKQKKTVCIEEKKSKLLKVNCADALGSGNKIKKGISQLKIDSVYINALKKHFFDVKFDLVLFSTPPITLCKCIGYVKKKNNAKVYLLLKDIFPQNAVDLGMMSTSGTKSFVYKHFRNKEKKLYSICDYIGCMSQANVEYLLSHNPEIDKSVVGVCPNTIEPVEYDKSKRTIADIRSKYNIPLIKTVFVYGGNLGKPQSVDFIIECLKREINYEKAFFLIVGDGTEYSKLESYIKENNPRNIKLIPRLPREDYNKMISACDVGLVFLDYRFTIPNFPSRLLTYMQAELPVISCTDKNSDIGDVIVSGDFGIKCMSNNTDEFHEAVHAMCESVDIKQKGRNSIEYLYNNFTAEHAYECITNQCGLRNTLDGAYMR